MYSQIVALANQIEKENNTEQHPNERNDQQSA
jgi:hypothetical protein